MRTSQLFDGESVHQFIQMSVPVRRRAARD